MESIGSLKAYPPLTRPTDVPLCSSSSQILVTENHMGSEVYPNTSIKGSLLGKNLNIEERKLYLEFLELFIARS